MIKLTLSAPPSANNLFVQAGKRRVRSAAYSTWRKAALFEIALQTKGKSVGSGYKVRITTGCNHKRDIDNMIKPILDVLACLNITPDDKWCDAVSIMRLFEHDSHSVTVEIV